MTGTLATIRTDGLTAADRCDRCGAQAFVHVKLAAGGELLFCGHHGKQYGDKLRSLATEFIDETGKLSGGSGTAS
ncbi:MAG: hypothetical protein M3P91_08910 [Actinomycetota bacterium]|nr:hypothetical protein [Actinomycetota bacterium]